MHEKKKNRLIIPVVVVVVLLNQLVEKDCLANSLGGFFFLFFVGAICLQRRIIGVSLFSFRVKQRRPGGVESGALLNAGGKIGIGQKLRPEGDGVEASVFDPFFGLLDLVSHVH